MLPRNLRNRSRLDLDRDPAAVCRHKLKAGVSLKQPVESFMEQLTQFSQVRGEILQRRERKMVDVPSSQWDRELLGGIFLPREGRTTTEEYMARPHAVFEVDRNDGCRYFVMRRSLRRLGDGDHFVLREPLEDELHKEKCLALADLQFADTQAKAENALRRLGASSPLSADPEKVLRLVSGYCVVCFSPDAPHPWWRSSHAGCAEHRKGVCQCKHFCIQGCCEHLYTAFAKCGVIDITVPCLRKPRGHRKGKADPVELPKKKKAKIPPSAPYGQAPGGAGQSKPARGTSAIPVCRDSDEDIRDMKRLMRSYQFFEEQKKNSVPGKQAGRAERRALDAGGPRFGSLTGASIGGPNSRFLVSCSFWISAACVV